MPLSPLREKRPKGLPYRRVVSGAGKGRGAGVRQGGLTGTGGSEKGQTRRFAE
jgi:hypothetical protein